MKIILVSIGTRGDMEPFLAVGEMLKAKGHHIICLFPGQFGVLAEESSMEFRSLGTKYIEMMNSEAGRITMGGDATLLKIIIANLKLAGSQNEANREMMMRMDEIIRDERPDRIVYNGKTVYPLLWEWHNMGRTTLICPMPYMQHYVRDHSHLIFNSNYGALLNRLTYSLAHFGMVTTAFIVKGWLKKKERIRRREIRKIIKEGKAIYTISPSLFTKPVYWHRNLRVLGYHERNRSDDWQPGQLLTDFLRRHNRVIFITFGSMINRKPVEKARILLRILERHGIPAIINTASGGLAEPEDYDTGIIHFVSRIPYDWIFPRVYAVIHHGGSGTTHMALKYGCSTMIIPHIIDQFVWNDIVSSKGVGPRGIRIGKITEKNMEPKILDLFRNSSFREKAEKVAEQMRSEDYKEELCKVIAGT